MPTDYHVVTIALDTTRAALERLGRTVVLHGVIVHGAFRTGDRPLGRHVTVDLVARVPVALLGAVQAEFGRFVRRWQDHGLQQRPLPPVAWDPDAMPASPPTWLDAARAAHGAVCAALGWHPETCPPNWSSSDPAGHGASWSRSSKRTTDSGVRLESQETHGQPMISPSGCGCSLDAAVQASPSLGCC